MKFPSKKAFRAFLEANSEKEVGYPCNRGGCPLANFLGSLGYSGAEVRPSTVFATDGQVCFLTPPWAQGFIARFDKNARGVGYTGRVALDALR